MGFLIEVLRDLVVLAAAAVVGLAAWDWYAGRKLRREDRAHAVIGTERHAQRMEEHAAQLTAQAGAIAGHLARLETMHAEEEQRSRLKSRIHALLHASREPFLTFGEIERGLALPADEGEAQTAPVGNGELRRALLELIAGRAVAQLEGDRYFIEAEFETDDE